MRTDHLEEKQVVSLNQTLESQKDTASMPNDSMNSETMIERDQQRVEDAKFYMGQKSWSQAQAQRELPKEYGDTRIVLMVVDPWWAYTYWEITPARIQEGLRFLGCSLEQTRSVIRVYDVTGLEGTDRTQHYFDLELSGWVTNWYIHVNGPDHSFLIEIGLLSKDGRFFALARSNTITMPRVAMSEVIDERWMSLEFEKMYALSGGFRSGAGSAELKEMMEKRLKEVAFSGSVSSFGGSPVGRKEQGRSFWFVVDAELIIYGATDPHAQVAVSGHPIQLRPDGTFTLRYALPDGRFPIPVTARSADGREERTITPIVERNTEISQPVLK